MTETQLSPTQGAPHLRTTRQVRRGRRRTDLKQLGELGALVVLIVLFAVLNPDTFMTLKNVRTILDQASLPLIIGVGATLVILMGSIDLSVEGVMGAAGMTFVLLSHNSRGAEGIGFWAIPAGVAIGVALGLVNGVVHTLLRVPSFIVTLGAWFVGLGIATVLFGQDQIPFLKDDALSLWPTHRTLGLPNDFLLAAAIVLLGAAAARFTRVGRFAYAIGNSEEIAASNGVAINRYKIIVFVVAGACSGLAGVVATMQLGAGSATVGVNNLFLTIAAVVIGGTSLGGGKGGVLRTAVGVGILTVLTNGLILSGVSPDIQSAVSGAVLVLAVIAASWPHRTRLRIVK